MSALEPLRFAVPEGFDADGLASALERLVTLVKEPPRKRTVAYLDSFDWRLFEQGTVLEAESGQGPPLLRWRRLSGGQELARLSGVAPPRFVADLPRGPLRERLAPIVEMRAVLPVARVRRIAQGFRVLNKDEKTTLRLRIEEDSRPGRSNGTLHGLQRRLLLLPVRGYAKPFHLIARLLQEDLGLRRDEQDPFLAALARTGQVPGGYSSKLRFALDPAQPTGAALRGILLHLLDTMAANEAGVAEDLDTEFLHDFRVAVRRTRSAITQVKRVLPAEPSADFAKEFAWLGRVTGPARDIDVYALKFDGYQASVNPAFRSDLDPLRDFLGRRKSAEQAALRKALQSDRYRRLTRDWRAFLEDGGADDGPLADRPVLETANRRIWRAYRRVLTDGAAIGEASPAEALHDLRKDCKKLRYLMEFFQSLYPEDEIKPVIKSLKLLQENLGDFQDLEVQSDSLMGFGRDMMAEGGTPAETFVAMGVLVDGLLRRQREARRAFAACFAAFGAKPNRAACKALFSPDPTEPTPADEDPRQLQH